MEKHNTEEIKQFLVDNLNNDEFLLDIDLKILMEKYKNKNTK